MKKVRTFFVHCSRVAFALVLLTAAVASSAAERTSIFLTGGDAGRAAVELVGRGIVFPDGRLSQAAADAHGRAIIWKEHRRSSDEAGGRHVFYRQYLAGYGVEAELVGSDMGFHYDANGVLTSVAGSQYRDVMVANTPHIDPVDAYGRARRSLVSFARIGGDIPADADPAESARRGTLQVAQGNDGALRYMWRVRLGQNRDGVDTVYVDAQSEQVHGQTDAARKNNCYPDTLSSVSANGVPVRVSGTRAIGATPLTYARGTYSHEAFWAAGPLLAVHQEVPAGTSWQCNYSTSYAGYSLVAINNVGGVPTYDDTTTFKGRAAGDAIYHTRQTMLAFSTMGWNSWDGAGSNATAIIESSYAGNDTGRFVVPDHPTQNNLPPGAAVAIGPSNNYYSMAAALDVVAHEWGHGVNLTRADFPVDSLDATEKQIANEMEEGFADVIGNIVERLRQTAGADNVLERSGDWTIHEDVAGTYNNGIYSNALGYARGARDDGTAGHYYVSKTNTLGTAIKDKLHKDDPDVTNATAPHTQGNMLVVVLRLLTDGGKNPLCSRSTPPAFCSTAPTVTAVTFTKARKIMWDTIARVPSTVKWTSTDPALVVANHAMEAAYQLNKMCNASPVYVPVAEQQAVYNAFANIGYPPTNAIKQTCQ